MAFVYGFFVWGNGWILIDLFWGFGEMSGFCRKKCRLWEKGKVRECGERDFGGLIVDFGGGVWVNQLSQTG